MVIVVLVVAVIVAGLLAYAATRPDHFRVARSIDIAAPPDRIFPFIEDFANWTQWSPYEGRDPAMKRSRSGAAQGKGAIYEWEGNNKVGKGRMEIIDSSPPRRTAIKLDFDRPFKAHNTAEFTLDPAGAATKVTWAMEGPSPFVARLMGLFFSMDRMIGRDFETGLANLKAAAERPALG
jgi:hypothetical protein